VAFSVHPIPFFDLKLDSKTHFNVPHSVALENCQKIYVERDYSQGLDVKFQRNFPPALDGLIDENDWYATVDGINTLFEYAETVNAGAVGETLLGFLTCYLVRLCMKTRYEKQLIEIRRFIDDRNHRIFIPAGLCLTDPVLRGFRVLEISVLSSGLTGSPTGNDEPTTSREQV